MAFVIGSYFLAQEVRVKRPQRRHRANAAPGDGGLLEQDGRPDGDARIEVDDVRDEHADAAV